MDYLKQLERINSLQTIVDNYDNLQTKIIKQIEEHMPPHLGRDKLVRLIKSVSENSFYAGVALDGDIEKIDSAIVGAIVMHEMYDTSVHDNLKHIIEQIKTEIQNSK
jgi:hypothetical protein